MSVKQTFRIRSLVVSASLLALGSLGSYTAAWANAAAHDEPDPHAKAKPAAGGHGATKPGAEAAAPKGKLDPMDALREKLANKLGATKPPEAATPYVMRVKNAEAAGHGGGEEDKMRAAKVAHGAAVPPHKPKKKAAAPVEHEEHIAPAAMAAPKLLAANHGAHGGAPHWDYAGEFGPDNWAQMKPEFAACSTGARQSPIDIRGGVKVDLEPIEFDYHPTGFSVADNGHTIQVNINGANAIEVQGKRFDLLQFHFHRPSEERINGRQYDMVAHLVHKSADGKLAVVAVLLDRGAAQPLIQSVWSNLPLEKGTETVARTEMDMNMLLPADRRYFTYMGSLTTPPCTEGVLWLVLQQPVPVASDQINVFSRLYPMNARPIQQASGRLIKQSN